MKRKKIILLFIVVIMVVGLTVMRVSAVQNNVSLRTLLTNDYAATYGNEQQEAGYRISAGLDTEGAEVEQLTVNGYPGFYYTKNNMASLIWADNDFAYSIIGKITKEIMIDLANSTK